MNKYTCRNLLAACLVLLALVSLGCRGGRSSSSGSCPPYNWYADQSLTSITGNGANVEADSQAVKSAVSSGRAFTVTDRNTGRSYTVKLSSGAASDLENQDPCAAIAEIMSVVTAAAAGRPAATPTPSSGPSTSNPPVDQATPGSDPVASPSATPLSGPMTLYPGDYAASDYSAATLTLARPAGFDPRQPAVYVFHGLKLDSCTLTLDAGQTVIYVDGALKCKQTTWNVPGSGTPSAPDARNLLILGTAACTKVTVEACPRFSAGLYAPAADVTLDGVKLFGGAVGRTMTSVNSTVQYDPHLRVVNYPGLGVASARSVDEKRE